MYGKSCGLEGGGHGEKYIRRDIFHAPPLLYLMTTPLLKILAGVDALCRVQTEMQYIRTVAH